MGLVLDSSAWIEWFVDGERAADVEAVFAPGVEILVPTLVVHEVHKWLARNVGEETADAVAGLLRDQTVVLLDISVALLASDLGRALKLSTADAIVLAHAQREGIDLVALDHAFEGVPGVRYFPKGGRRGTM